MEVKQQNIMGMTLDVCTHKSCRATIGVGEDFASVYSIESEEKGKGHATELLIEAKKKYEGEGKRFGSTIALNGVMKRILIKLDIPEFK